MSKNGQPKDTYTPSSVFTNHHPGECSKYIPEPTRLLVQEEKTARGAFTGSKPNRLHP
ncbi:hypothetical protein GJ744_006276 [Endocarpon pusillum]|uniref:Uncharacterized protein n=1 Tax=Endocarpon pusillum TaxID=364733 RepID=A0A8H7DYD9_9EURO|nr:hypothetical protein GJ744_006276 [Endocarpon pusillum]